MDKQIVIIEGKNCISEIDFYYEFYNKFTDIEMLKREGYLTEEGKYKGIGFNLDAADEILYGDWGIYAEGENNIVVIIKDFQFMKEKLSSIPYMGKNFFEYVFELFSDHSNHIEVLFED